MRADATRTAWLATLEKFRHDRDRPATEAIWSPRLESASRDELRAIQDEKLRAVVPFLYENSGFYRRRFERLGLLPDDIRGVDDLVARWPVVDKSEMMADALEHPPYGTYTAMTDAVWAERGWMMFASSGTSGVPRVFRYSHVDRAQWAWANARALHAMDVRRGDTVFMMTGYGPHVFAWGVQVALFTMGLPTLPGGGMDARARVNVIQRFRPTILLCTPSYALHLARVAQEMGHEPAKLGVRTILVGGEPALSIEPTRRRIEALWNARLVEFYGCTEASPHVGGYSCAALQRGGPVATHLAEDIQIWETVDPDTRAPVAAGARGLTVCTNLNSEASPQLRFLVGDFATLDEGPCACGRTHARAVGAFGGRADDLINLRGVKMYPVQLEEAVRAIPDAGDEFEIVLETDPAGLDIMTVRFEHPAHGSAGEALRRRLADEIRTRCEVRVAVEVVAPGTLPKTEFKARRVRDVRGGGRGVP
ncbi:MAG TPA: AMP-binding protein [Candidatus Tectomicrobia bacterium]|nr:AMP-binding protein [Candidatus Tectomicrobia bacterium]